MTQIEILTEFDQLLIDIKQSFDKYNNNFVNETFKKQSFETNEQSYERGMSMFNQLCENMNNLKEILDKQNEMNKFFKKCRQNHKIMTKQKNDLINNLSKIKKESVDEEEWEKWKEEWDEKREETKNERNRRECEEMLEKMKEKEQNIKKIKQEIENEKNELLNVKKDLEEKINQTNEQKTNYNENGELKEDENDYIKISDIPVLLKDLSDYLIDEIKLFSDKENDYLKKDEILNLLKKMSDNLKEEENETNENVGMIINDIKFKFILIGDSGVGKTQLLKQYVDKQFSSVHEATICVDFAPKQISIDEQQARLQIWDTSGDERFRSVTKSYNRGSDACILVCDVTNQKSFENLQSWKKEFVESQSTCPEDFPFIVIANKTDLGERVVSHEQLTEWCEANGCELFECSAKTDLNVEDAFTRAAKLAKEKLFNQN